jgi:hypothetical protein
MIVLLSNQQREAFNKFKAVKGFFYFYFFIATSVLSRKFVDLNLCSKTLDNYFGIDPETPVQPRS